MINNPTLGHQDLEEHHRKVCAVVWYSKLLEISAWTACFTLVFWKLLRSRRIVHRARNALHAPNAPAAQISSVMRLWLSEVTRSCFKKKNLQVTSTNMNTFGLIGSTGVSAFHSQCMLFQDWFGNPVCINIQTHNLKNKAKKTCMFFAPDGDGMGCHIICKRERPQLPIETIFL